MLENLLQGRQKHNLSSQAAMTLGHCCDAVCRIAINNAKVGGQATDVWGTGFVIAPRLIMTNHHVLKTADECKGSQAEFFLESQNKKVIVQFKPEELFITSSFPEKSAPSELTLFQLDYTIVAIEDHPDLKEVFAHPISLNEYDNAQEKENINAIHYPYGGSKSVASAKHLHHQVVKVDRFYFTYHADTSPGSSGCPILSASFRLLGLHRQTEGLNPTTDKVAIKIAAIYANLRATCEKGLTISHLERIAQFRPAVEKGSSEHSLNVLRKAYQKDSFVERFSGEKLALSDSYINIQIVKEAEQTAKEEKLRQEQEEASHSDQEQIAKSNPLHHTSHLTTFEEIYAPKKPIEIENLFDELKKHPEEPARFLVLGKAGIGKSTFCRYISYQWAGDALWKDHFEWVFWISAREIENQDMKQMIYRRWFQHEFTFQEFDKVWENQIMRSKKVLFLIDGWDELSSKIDNFAGLFSSSVHLLITSRPQNIQDFSNYQQFEITGFTDANVQQYIQNCLKNKDEQQALCNYLKHTPTLFGIAHIPIQLDLICYHWKNRPNKTAQDLEIVGMSTMYYSLEISLLRKSLKDPHLLDSEIEKRGAPLIRFLSSLAFEATQQESLIISSDLASQVFSKLELQQATWRETLKIGLLKEMTAFPGKRPEYYFLHLTFQEYYAARHLVYLLQESPTEARQFIREHKYNPRMQIVFWFTAGICRLEDKRNPNAHLLDDLIEEFLAKPKDLIGLYEAQLAIRLLEEGGLPESSAGQKLFKTIQKKVMFHLKQEEDDDDTYLLIYLEKIMPFFQLSPRYTQKEIVQPFVQGLQVDWKGKMGEKSTSSNDSESLGKSLLKLKIGTKYEMLRALQVSDPKVIESLITAVLKDPKQRVRIDACIALRRLQVSDPEVIGSLITVALKDPKQDVRLLACYALSKLHVSDQTVIERLITLVLKDPNEEVRNAACYALRELQVSDPKVIEPLITTALKDSPNLRRAACCALIKLQVSDPKVIETLTTAALKDSDPAVRLAACKTLEKLQVSDPSKVIEPLVMAVLKDSYVQIRVAARDALVNLQMSDPKLIEPLIMAVLKDSDEDVRVAACYVLLKFQVSHPDVIETLTTAALKDSDPTVRADACEALGKIRLSDPKIIEILIMVALKDPHEAVRKVACYALGMLQVSESKMIETLITLKDPDEDIRKAIYFMLKKHKFKLIELLKDIPSSEFLKYIAIFDRASWWCHDLLELNLVDVLDLCFHHQCFGNERCLKFIFKLAVKEQCALYIEQDKLIIYEKSGKRIFPEGKEPLSNQHKTIFKSFAKGGKCTII